MLTGYPENPDAIAGDMDPRGRVSDVRDICAIIEIMFDAGTRVAPMQRLSKCFLVNRRTDDLAGRHTPGELLASDGPRAERISCAQRAVAGRPVEDDAAPRA